MATMVTTQSSYFSHRVLRNDLSPHDDLGTDDIWTEWKPIMRPYRERVHSYSTLTLENRMKPLWSHRFPGHHGYRIPSEELHNYLRYFHGGLIELGIINPSYSEKPRIVPDEVVYMESAEARPWEPYSLYEKTLRLCTDGSRDHIARKISITLSYHGTILARWLPCERPDEERNRILREITYQWDEFVP